MNGPGRLVVMRKDAGGDHRVTRRRLSTAINRIEDYYDVVIVGSGYGGSVCAARLVLAGRRVCVLERGRELRPGDFPRSTLEAAGEVQLRTGSRRFGRRTGLFDIRSGTGATVLVGCGLGGTSLINAGVAMPPPAWIFNDERWPLALRGDGDRALAPYLRRARQMLAVTAYPDSWPSLSKVEALERIATAVGGRVERPEIAVSFRSGPNHAGVEQSACQLCGNCVTGCNYGAKGTLTTNYLPFAVDHGAAVFTEVEVLTTLRSRDGTWVVSFRGGTPPSQFVRAGVVLLAAGALGSTEILLRSRAAGLRVSDRLGEGFNGNGGGLAFAYAGSSRIADWGRGRHSPPTEVVGPSIAGVLRLADDLLLEEGAIPAAVGAFTPVALAMGDRRGVAGPLSRLGQLARIGRMEHREPARRTLALLLTGDEAGAGQLTRRAGDVGIHLSGGVGGVQQDERAGLLTLAAQGLGGRLVTDPFAIPSRLSVHPLGGCSMADSGDAGVVDDRGRVFDGPGASVHDGLYVVDGSTLPRPLTVNPLLTISALAERAADLLIEERGWGPAGRPVNVPNRPAPPTTRPGLRFTERLRGYLGRCADADPAAGADQGRADGTVLDCSLTLAADDVPATLADLSRPWTVTGTVVAPALASRRLRVVDGRFRLVDGELDTGNGFRAGYRLGLLADDGRRFSLEGVKEIHLPRGWSRSSVAALWNLWGRATTLPVVATDAATGTIVAAGIAGISTIDLARQLSSVRLPEFSPGSGLTRLMELAGLTGKVPTARRTVALRGARRPLRVPVPEPRWCGGDGRWHAGDDIGPDAWLRLIRYRGGSRGPVMLAAGFSMSATSFLIDTIDTNLVEYLVAHGYDVWLFDYRAGIDLPSARSAFTMDDIATIDWPAAVAEVRRVTGADTIQAVGHCVGSVTLMMALAAGLTGVRSGVCLQVTMHPVVSSFNLAKATLRLGRVLRLAGADRIAPVRGVSLAGDLANTLLRAVPAPPHERCGRAICDWVNAMYGSTHRHAQLNDATHELLDDLFDVGNLAALEHLSRIVRGRAATDASGADRYLSHPERLRLPLLLVQGECNDIFRPEGSLRTLRWLEAANGPALYQRVVLPGYAHLDALIGANAARDVYPIIRDHLDRWNAG